MKVTIDIPGLTKFYQAISTNSPVLVKTLKQWAFRYRAFVQRRFAQYSHGAGDWPKLSPRTIARRRKGKRNTSHVDILRDTGTLFRALQPEFLQLPGQLEDINGIFQVEVGYGGPAKHPNGPATVADIASFHNFGMGHNPRRQIIVNPTPELIVKMQEDAARNLSKVGWDFTK